MSQRLPVRVKILSRTGANAVTVRTTLTLKPGGEFELGEVLTLLHMLPEHHRVTLVSATPDFMEGGWSLFNGRTNEKCGHVKPEN